MRSGAEGGLSVDTPGSSRQDGVVPAITVMGHKVNLIVHVPCNDDATGTTPTRALRWEIPCILYAVAVRFILKHRKQIHMTNTGHYFL